MGIILEIAGIISIIAGVLGLMTGSAIGSSLSLIIILGGILLWAIGSTNIIVKENGKILEELKIWMQAKR